ncbi:MAG: DUF5946 family protein, partial [Chloroflexota bacterium]
MKPGADQAYTTCPECGAAIVNGLTCWEQLGRILAWEYQDRELADQHFLTVASYNIQHPAQFTAEAIERLRAAFVEHLDRGTSVRELRRRAASAYEGHTRVLRAAEKRRQVLRAWSITIADVYIPDRPQGAAARVKAWA